jgi:hypothetical protein
MDEFHPRMMDELTDAVTIVTRATGCLQTVNQCKNILATIHDSLTGNSTKMMLDREPDVTVCAADTVLRVLVSDLAELETVRDNLDELIRLLEKDHERRIADRLQGRNLILYGVSVS